MQQYDATNGKFAQVKKERLPKQNEMKLLKLMWLILKNSLQKKIQGHCCNKATTN